MRRIEKNRKHPVSAGQYATVADFKRIFTEDVNKLKQQKFDAMRQQSTQDFAPPV
jgi:hypothetical protein